MRSFSRGFGFYLRGFGLVFQPGIRRFVILPMVLNALLFAGLVWLAAWGFDDVVTSAEGALPDWLDWIGGVLWLLFSVALFFVLIFAFLAVGSLLAAPFNGPLAESVELRLTGQPLPSAPWPRVLLRLPHTLIQETLKILYFVFWAVIFLLAFLVPVANLAAPVLWFLFTAWMGALDSSDYVMDNHGLPFREMRRRLWMNLPMAMGFGTAMVLVLSVPLLNLVALPVAVCGATVMWVERLAHIPPPGMPSA